MKNKKGFTLVELLAVVAIIAILMIIALPNVMKLFRKSTEETMLIQETEVLDAANLYKQDNCGRTAMSSEKRRECAGLLANNKIGSNEVYFCLSTIQDASYAGKVLYSGGTPCSGIVVYEYNENNGTLKNGKTYLSCGENAYVTEGYEKYQSQITSCGGNINNKTLVQDDDPSEMDPPCTDGEECVPECEGEECTPVPSGSDPTPSVRVVFHKNKSGEEDETITYTFNKGVSGQRFGYREGNKTTEFSDWEPNGKRIQRWSTNKNLTYTQSASSGVYSTYSTVTDNWIEANNGLTVDLYAVWRPTYANIYFIAGSGATIQNIVQIPSGKKNANGTPYYLAGQTVYFQLKNNITIDINGTNKTLNNVIYRKKQNESNYNIYYYYLYYLGEAYGEGNGLPSPTNPEYINLTKNNCTPKNKAEWKCASGSTCTYATYDQSRSDYKSTHFCDSTVNDCTVVLEVNWKCN